MIALRFRLQLIVNPIGNDASPYLQLKTMKFRYDRKLCSGLTVSPIILVENKSFPNKRFAVNESLM